MSHTVVNPKYCKGCLICMDTCPKKCYELSGKTNNGGYDYVMFKEGSPCVGCALCYTVCPDLAITVYRE